MLMWLAATAVVVLTAVLFAASLRLIALTGFLLAVYVLAVGESSS